MKKILLSLAFMASCSVVFANDTQEVTVVITECGIPVLIPNGTYDAEQIDELIDIFGEELC